MPNPNELKTTLAVQDTINQETIRKIIERLKQEPSKQQPKTETSKNIPTPPNRRQNTDK